MSFERLFGKAEWLSLYSIFQQDIHDQGKIEEFHTTAKGTLKLFHPIEISLQIGFTQNTDARKGISQDRLLANLGMAVRLSPEHIIQLGFQWTRLGQRNHVSMSETISTNLDFPYDPAARSDHILFIDQYALNQQARQASNSQSYDLSLFVQKDVHDLLHFPHRK